ncbi:nitrogen regulatory protein P-II [Proteiniborus sp. DW1]|uniref:P-II family nitrogen regulator n=1 Tax=Proteiniborus sp. DW1 TaxID=1889883 RepID=UPI00092E1CC1|nr:P-II family nitrogen regulator [Proteiniborus sp. DW1]SCG84408.1 nitrogen regulatory protein P-II [Proteiniborus sp. DW1]
MTVNNADKSKYSLIITIVKKGLGPSIIDITKNSGADGGTILLGKGIADKNIYQNVLGMDFELERDIILTLVQQEDADNVLDAISSEASLNKPGNGISFIIDVKNHLGITQLLDKWTSKKGGF